MAEVLTIVLATSNSGKLAELRALLADLPIQFLSAQDVLGEKLTIIEDGATFEENALIKARAVCRATRLVALADDSGLEVDALGGRPGVRSARFAHERATDAENNAALLRELENIEEGARGARFRCVLALVSPWQESEQHVARAPRQRRLRLRSAVRGCRPGRPRNGRAVRRRQKSNQSSRACRETVA
jgi:XTP/dITP diphosphohydrolase